MSKATVMLEDMETPFGRIKIYETPDEQSRTYYQDSCFHSRCDLKGHSLIAYVHGMCGIMLQANAKKTLVLGCAGGNLCTMLADAGCSVVTVDINRLAFELAKQYFFLPDAVGCVVDDARHYLEHANERFDAIALDVFDGGQIPKHLRTVEFFQLAASRLSEKGVIVVNAIVEHDLDMQADNLAASIKKATGKPVLILDQFNEPDRNVVIIGGTIPEAVLPMGSEPEDIQKELRTMHLRPIRKPSLAYYDGKGI